MSVLIKTIVPASGIQRVSMIDADYVPYYFNCKECNEPLNTEADRYLGKCETCVMLDEMEVKP